MNKPNYKPFLYVTGFILLYFLVTSCGLISRRTTSNPHSYNDYEKRRQRVREYTRCFDSYLFRGLTAEEAKILCGRKVGNLYE